MKLPVLFVDAFTDGPFSGNPAGVVPLEAALSAEVMQKIAAEHNLSETAFTVPRSGEPGRFELRWFTPEVEVELCGHATLGAAAALRATGALEGASEVRFDSPSGELVARFDGELIEIDLPRASHDRPASAEVSAAVERALGVTPRAVLADRYVMAVLDDEAAVRALAPQRDRLVDVDEAVIATAPGDSDDVDFVSRFFCPTYGIDEDPVTGSAHCQTAPYWASVLGKDELSARQISARGGRIECTIDGERVRLAGRAHVYLRGEIDTGDAPVSH